MPELASESGLPQAQVSMTGQTLIAAEVAQLTRDSLEITLVVALIVELLILALYLRALVAPIALLACSVLSVTAALGLTTLLFQNILGEQGLTFYAPFSAAVLLIALGSDYNVFSVGSIWAEAKRRPLARSPYHRRPSGVSRHHRCRADPGRDVRPGRHHPAVDVPPDRLRHVRGATPGHPGHSSRADSGGPDLARSLVQLAEQARHHR